MGTKKVTVGILAHVDAGKTTLAEAILYRTGTLRRLGRVDHQDAFLDTDAMFLLIDVLYEHNFLNEFPIIVRKPFFAFH